MTKYVNIHGVLLGQSSMIRLPLVLILVVYLYSSAAAQLTLTERLIREEVMEADGQWEGSDRVPLLGFIGEKFTDEHFELVAHIRAIEWFHVSEVNVEPESLRWLSRQPLLTKLDLIDSGNLIDGLHLLGDSVLGRLESVRISGTTLSRKNLFSISKMRRLTALEALDVEVNAESLVLIAKCKSLAKLEIRATNDIPISVVSDLEEKLPDCEVTISGQKRSADGATTK